jgi:hypothetical protein
MTIRKATKQKRLDLWLDDADLTRLTELTDIWLVSRQRVIESALTYATTAKIPLYTSDHYARRQRIPLNLDGLALAQVAQLAEQIEASDGIRAALRAFHASSKQRESEQARL